MQNLRGELCLLLGNDGTLVHIASLAFLVASVVWVIVLWRKHSWSVENSDRLFKIKASITTLLLLISSPHTHKHDYVLAVVPAVWLWDSLVMSQDSPQRLRKICKAMIMAIPVASWIFFMFEPVFHLIKIQPFFIWASVLCGLAYGGLLATRKTDSRGADAKMSDAV